MSALLSAVVLAFAAVLPQDSLTLSLATLAAAERSRVTIDEENLRLDEALEVFSRKTGLPVRAEWDALQRISVDRDERVAWRAADLPAIVALRDLAASLGTDLDRPVVDASQGSLILTTLRGLQAHRETALYDVADIAADPTLMDALEQLVDDDASPVDDTTAVDDRDAAERLAALAGLLMDHIDPEGWLEAGGSRARMSVAAGRLVITASPGTHRELRRLLGTIRRQAPTAGTVRISLVGLPQSAAEDFLRRFASAATADRARMLSECGAAPESARLAAAQLLVRLGEEAQIQSRSENGDALDLDATILLRIDRTRRSLALSLGLDAGGSRVRTTLDFPLLSLPSGELVPLSGAEVLLLPDSRAGQRRLVLIEVSLRGREEDLSGSVRP